MQRQNVHSLWNNVRELAIVINGRLTGGQRKSTELSFRKASGRAEVRTWNLRSNINLAAKIGADIAPSYPVLILWREGVCDSRRGLGWWMYLLTTCTHNSELPLPICIIHKSPQHLLSLSRRTWEDAEGFGGKVRMKETTRKIVLKWNLERYDGLVWTGFICLRITTSGGLLWTVRFHKVPGNWWKAVWQLVSQEGVSSL
jgi:hypothetical protein